MLGGLNARTVVLSLLVAGLVTGGNLWLHRGDTPMGYTEYNRHGLSFRYPSDWSSYEGGFTDPEAGATKVQGVFQAVHFSETRIETIMVAWAAVNASIEAPDGGAPYVDEVIQDIDKSPNTTIVSVGPYVVVDKGGVEVTYAVFTLVQRGLPLTAVVGVMAQPWPSLGNYRAYVLSYAADSASSSEAQVEESFLEFLDGFRSPA